MHLLHALVLCAHADSRACACACPTPAPARDPAAYPHPV